MKQTELQPAPVQPVDEALLQEIVRKIVAHCHPRRIILFGSRARGEARSDSDVDLLVEMETTEPMLIRQQKIHSLFRGRRWGLDLLVFTPEEIAQRRTSLASIVGEIEREGRVLYERP
jgi:predicted nucleotidyltransferase